MLLETMNLPFPREAWGMTKQNGTFGVELELEGAGMQPFDIPGWAVHNEGSLRNGGVEFVTNSSVTREQLTFRLRELNRVLNNNGVQLNPEAYRTSTHIHFNIQGETLGFLLGVGVVFAIVEPLMLRLCGSKRDGNHFCLGMVDGGDYSDMAEELISFIRYGGRGGRVGRGKYSALNYTRVTDLGTVEFRCFPMSTSDDQIGTWCDWITRITDLARAANDPLYRGYIKQAQRDPVGFAQAVFGYRMDLDEPTIRDLVLLGCQGAYEISRCIKHQTVLDEREKKMMDEGKKARKVKTDWGV